MPNIGIRSLSPEASKRFAAGAQMRSLTLAQYLERLLELHAQVRATADMEFPDDATGYCAGLLETLGLQTVHKEG